DRMLASADGRTLLVAMKDGNVSVYDVESRHLRRRFRVPSRTDFLHCDVSPDGTMLALAAGKSEFIEVWDLDKAKQLWRRPAGTAQRGAFSPDNAWIAIVSENGEGVNLHDAHTGHVVRSIPSGLPRDANGIRVSYCPDGKQ